MFLLLRALGVSRVYWVPCLLLSLVHLPEKTSETGFHFSANFSDLSQYILDTLSLITVFFCPPNSSLSINGHYLQRPLLKSHLSLLEAGALPAVSVPGVVVFCMFMFSLTVVKLQAESVFPFKRQTSGSVDPARCRKKEREYAVYVFVYV